MGGLWRNFQGFTTKAGTDLVGLGVTSISSYDDAFSQNVKDLGAYGAAVESGGTAAHRGMWLTEDDRIRRAAIQQIMCAYRLDPGRLGEEFGIDAADYLREGLARLAPLEADGLIRREGDGFSLTSAGRVFVRNVCMAFDAHLTRSEKPVFSRTI